MKHRLVVSILLNIYPLAFLVSPVDFIKSGEALVPVAIIQKRLYTFFRTKKCAAVYFVKRHRMVGLMKSCCLLLSGFVQPYIYSRALYNTHFVVFGLAVAYQVYFFSTQFVLLCPKNTFLSLFDATVTPDSLNKINQQTLAHHLGMEFIEVGDDYLIAKMPVDARTRQPLGLLHGGASVALAETLGSVAAYCTIDRSNYYCLGLEIHANHIKSAKSGYVYGKTFPIHVGKKTQLWQIDIRNEAGELVCISKITMIVLPKEPPKA